MKKNRMPARRNKTKSAPPALRNTQQGQAAPAIVGESKMFYNSLGSLLDALAHTNLFSSQQISEVDTLFNNNRWYMLSNMRQVLSQIYVEHGIVQTLVDQPVDDAFRGGYEIKSKQLSPEDVEFLERDNEADGSNEIAAQCMKWNRLFGGAGLMISTGQDPDKPLEELKQGDLLKFIDADLWELFYNKQNTDTQLGSEPYGMDIENPQFRFNYYGHNVHPSRVIMLKGKRPPSFIRPRLRGWGMSELERLVRSLNSYLKNQDLIFELIDEAKIDAYKIEGFNAALATAAGTQRIHDRIQMGNGIKNFQHALIMDKEDEWDQKQINFSGISDIGNILRQGIAADLKMPMTKLFGISSAGFNSGEDDIENYNSMVEGEVRYKVKPVLIKMIQIKCQKLFGFTPSDLEIKFPTLRILGAKEEEEVKNAKASRINMFFSSGLISVEDAKQSINKGNLLDIKVDENDEIFDNPRVPDETGGLSISKSSSGGGGAPA